MKSEVNKNNLNYFIGAALVGVFCVFYIVFPKPFAETHINLPGLNFPIFMGEILTAICLLLLSKDIISINFKKLTSMQWCLIGYGGFIVIKALYGYFSWGPLALRHTALLYYPIFIPLVYFFLRSFKLNNFCLRALPLIISVLFFNDYFYSNWTLSLYLVGMFCALVQKNKLWKTTLIILLTLSIPYEDLFKTSRMMFLSNLMALLFLIGAFAKALPIKSIYKIIFVVILLTSFSFGVYKFANHKKMLSIIKLDKIFDRYDYFDKKVQAKKGEFEFQPLNDIKLFNPQYAKKIDYEYVEVVALVDEEVVEEKTEKPDVSLDEEHDLDMPMVEIMTGSTSSTNQVVLEEKVVKTVKKKKVIKRIRRPILNKSIDVGVSYTNAAFRLLIWRDMFVELFDKKALLGFGFGKPLRSMSIEINNIALSEWSRDGWIAAHNSYFHMIYRTGIIGVLFIMFLLASFFRVAFYLIKIKSIPGILLSAVLIIWMVAANFLLIFELPYTAIPIWSLAGFYYYYYKTLRDSQEKTT